LMVQKILKLDEIPKPDDAADAIAVAITHINSLTNSLYTPKVALTAPTKVEKEIKSNRMTAKEFRELLLKK
ncbi:MAG: crossover junction endodeoxyribonuclease RuvC, partial [Cetobacterium sp.]